MRDCNECIYQGSSLCETCTDYRQHVPKVDAEIEWDSVNNVLHYQLFDGEKQVIDLIKDRVSYCDNPVTAYHYGNAIKYLMRWMHKNGLEDLKKCKTYIDYIIEIGENR